MWPKADTLVVTRKKNGFVEIWGKNYKAFLYHIIALTSEVTESRF